MLHRYTGWWLLAECCFGPKLEQILLRLFSYKGYPYLDHGVPISSRRVVSCGFRIGEFVIGDRCGFPVHYALEPVSAESLKILVLFDDPPRIFAASLRDV